MSLVSISRNLYAANKERYTVIIMLILDRGRTQCFEHQQVTMIDETSGLPIGLDLTACDCVHCYKACAEDQIGTGLVSKSIQFSTRFVIHCMLQCES